MNTRRVRDAGSRSRLLRLGISGALMLVVIFVAATGGEQALGSTAMRPVKATEQLITHPVETAKGLPSGVERLFGRVEPQPVAR